MVTITDIAKEVGVTTATVSYVLNGRNPAVKISKKTSERVEKAAVRLGYYRNEIARSMVTGRTNVIGVLTFETGSEYFAKILTGIMETATQKGFHIKLFSLRIDDDLKKIVGSVFGQRLAGIICRSLTPETLNYLKKELATNNIPIALVDSSFSHSWAIRIMSDDVKGAGLAVKHLGKLGHVRIAHVTNDLKRGYAAFRKKGFMDTMASLGLTVLKKYLVINDDIEQIETQVLGLLAGKNPPTAIFCGSDLLAMVVLRAVNTLGLKVPDDISVVGYANLRVAPLTIPPLTTVEQPFVDMGRTVSDFLIQEINREDAIKNRKHATKKLEVKLIVRQSTGPNYGVKRGVIL